MGLPQRRVRARQEEDLVVVLEETATVSLAGGVEEEERSECSCFSKQKIILVRFMNEVFFPLLFIVKVKLRFLCQSDSVKMKYK